jgi:hypothetical protein
MAETQIVTFDSLAPTEDNEPQVQNEPTGAERCLADYSVAYESLEAFKAEHFTILAQLEFLQQCVTGAETVLKAACREHGTVANERFVVTVQTKWRRWYDVDTLVVRVPSLKEIPGVIVQTVDRAKVESLIKAGTVAKADAEAVLHTEALTPAVTIKRL